MDLLSSSYKYDVAIAGAGLSGLSLAYKIKKNPKLSHLRLALIDPSPKNKNDRTWCFWSKERDCFEDILYTKWNNIEFSSTGFTKTLEINPYSYKMIRGIDFYKHTLEFLKSQDKVDFYNEKIHELSESSDDIMTIQCEDSLIKAKKVFKSYYDKKDFSKDHFVWQHFKGWIIETEEDCFDADKAVFMDFRVEQDNETRFFYVLPFSTNQALVEIAVFSENIPEESFYDPFLEAYIKNHITEKNYTIIETELGAIPMTTHNFVPSKKTSLIHIGTNAGSVKASSGYAYKRIQEETDKLIKFMEEDRLDKYHPSSNRYHFYDKILLNVILSGKASGKKIFECLFQKLKPQTIFSFLDEEGKFINELKVFSAPPSMPFIIGYLQEMYKKVIGS